MSEARLPKPSPYDVSKAVWDTRLRYSFVRFLPKPRALKKSEGNRVGDLRMYLIYKRTLSEEDVPGGSVDIFIARVARVNHQTVDEFHRFSPLTSEFT